MPLEPKKLCADSGPMSSTEVPLTLISPARMPRPTVRAASSSRPKTYPARPTWPAFASRSAAVDWAQASGTLAWIDLEVLSVNAPARGLYARCGFVQTGEISDLFRIDGESLAYTAMSLALRRG